jgi:flagellar FliJ protein
MEKKQMANLESLIRLRKHNVDEKQKILAALYSQANLLENRKEELKSSLEQERRALEENVSPEMLSYFGNFAQAIRDDIDRIDHDLKNLETRIDAAREKVREAFADMKRAEIVDRQRKEEQKKETDTKESNELNEIGIEGFRRKEDLE